MCICKSQILAQTILHITLHLCDNYLTIHRILTETNNTAEPLLDGL